MSVAPRPMRFGIVGCGKMGREIAAAAERRGHCVAWMLGSAENAGSSGIRPDRVAATDAVFEFTAPEAARSNLLALARLGSRVVCGTTGWAADLPGISEAFRSGGGALVHATNFSIGVRHLFDLAARSAALYGSAGYSSYLVEEHHAGKKDAPSGTARTLAAIVGHETGREPPVASIRAGTIPGTHRLVFESPEDEVELIHRARGRSGFARGAVWAAEWIVGKTGVFEFGEVLRETSGPAKEDP